MKKSNILYVASYKKREGYIIPARKVGITGGGKSTKNSRMKILSNSTEAYNPVEAIQSWKLPDEIPAKDVEIYLHELFDILGIRTNREWFDGKTDDEENIIEQLVEHHMKNLRTYNFKIEAEHEKIYENEDKEIVDSDNQVIKIRGKKTPLPQNVFINGNPIEYKSFADILRETFKYLVDLNKITENLCPYKKSSSNKSYIFNTIPEHEKEKPFRHPYKYKGIYLETHGSAGVLLDLSKFLIKEFGKQEVILKIEGQLEAQEKHRIFLKVNSRK